ncbi:aminotransferase class V-fold PLP-dependent enzyme [Methylopila sp. M107]|uniref:pyridoxal phosphate-dependent decarboxylase family protein n=1 Tax=Methylopila sp. M107 TaxID=1101190 RepID=UPI00039F6366|nr:aminotransferase class V-fold PLP-dependent enzyme [Methylopila sp. M107]
MDAQTPAGPSAADLQRAFQRALDLALAHAARGSDAPAFRRAHPDALGRLGDVPDRGRPLDEALAALIEDGLSPGMDTGHRRFFAFIPSPASPVSWLGEFAAAVHNRHAGSELQSQGVAAIERAVVRFLCDAAGYPQTSGGLFVSGGSTANLAGLCVARDQRLGEAKRSRGVVYLTRETHSSVAKALRILGFFDSQIRVVAIDGARRMDVAALAAAVTADRDAGRRPFAVVASAGTTNTGAVDPLSEIADLCGRENLWLHVDGAYGASALLSPAHRPLLAGIERADSLSWDAHKWLFQTYGCGMLLVRDRSLLAPSFALTSDYLRDGAAEGVEPNFWDLGPELTRPARAARLWLTLQTMGRDGMAAAIAHGFSLAQAAEKAVRATPGWIVVSPAQLAITAFRYAPAALSDEDADAANAQAARRLMEEGFAVVGTTRLDGRLSLRICAIHPQATAADMTATVKRLDELVRGIG